MLKVQALQTLISIQKTVMKTWKGVNLFPGIQQVLCCKGNLKHVSLPGKKVLKDKLFLKT